MMRGLSLVLAFIVVAGFAATIPGVAYACSCAAPAGGSEQERTRRAAEGAQAVFAGEVASIEYLSLGTVISSDDPIEVTFDVSRVWKGPAYETLTVETARSGASCGYDFDEGRQYLVYADSTSTMGESSEALQVGLCGATTLVPDASVVTLLSEKGALPDAENPSPRGSQTNAALPDTGGASLAAMSTALLGVAAILLVRKWSS